MAVAEPTLPGKRLIFHGPMQDCSHRRIHRRRRTFCWRTRSICKFLILVSYRCPKASNHPVPIDKVLGSTFLFPLWFNKNSLGEAAVKVNYL
ncbi:hypothetical protein BD410DRAFT_373052 [Rickenella mellea]|uniref:Uncharacterized protein n=1 Tax=Rickenella mellea TaxID=50990 RepID=A0A4Y7Q102_9AGAM|nr:hypothetical protein BD410DRAFT_373052 [Rickenella mellea]